jgi:hypothetical protein
VGVFLELKSTRPEKTPPPFPGDFTQCQSNVGIVSFVFCLEKNTHPKNKRSEGAEKERKKPLDNIRLNHNMDALFPQQRKPQKTLLATPKKTILTTRKKCLLRC